MLRLTGFLLMLVIGAGGFLALDYNMARQQAAGDAPLSIEAYLDNLTDRIAAATRSAPSSGLPDRLQDMLPRAPEGWTARPTIDTDVDPFLPRDSGVDRRAVELLKSVLQDEVDWAEDVALISYEAGDRIVVIQAVRYPDAIFTDQTPSALRFDLQSRTAVFRGISSMTVRGLDVTEDILPDGIRARLFMADVGGQIHLRMLTPNRMRDDEIVAFLETLHVEAMNAAVVNQQEGLGKVPVIVLASALDRDARDAFYADRTARAQERAAALREARAAALAASAPDGQAPAAEGPAMECVAGAGGVKRCKVGD